MKLIDILAVIALMVGSALLSHYFWPKEAENKKPLPVKTDTVYVTHTVTDTLPGEMKLIPVKEKVNIDSLWEEAKAYAIALIYKDKKQNKDSLGNYKFVMEADTTYRDSLLSENIKFVSPIPLHPKSYFVRSATWRTPLIREVYLKPETFWQRFSWSINAGFGYGVIHKEFDFYVGVGGSFRIR